MKAFFHDLGEVLAIMAGAPRLPPPPPLLPPPFRLSSGLDAFWHAKLPSAQLSAWEKANSICPTCGCRCRSEGR